MSRAAGPLPSPAYLVASRQGIYAVDHHRWRLLVAGQFFGIVCAGGDIFAFRHGAAGDSVDPNSGCVVHYVWLNERLVEQGVVVSSLDHNVHQLEHIDGTFFLVDTLDQSIREYDAAWQPRATHAILPPAPRDGPNHAHVNSVAGTADAVWVMLHNGVRKQSSEIIEYDRDFNERGRTVLPCSACHDIVPLSDGRLMTCLSPHGALLVGADEVHPIDELWTRGLVFGCDEIAVGSSLYGQRLGRKLLPGFLTFLDHSFRRIGRIYVPAAPTQIRPLPFDAF